ncbi:hypothetical protein K491DRAFT_231410 [Lophiostoma macrostomum CBS 122681]|uniref:Uncharacterized protein n=1 Tax=Lophiostoma macrostomum CBS 122681 TaxID=1314788 RepID=A0A6A6SQ66_9PLEO|nr:hypothetical protein K491DRAFT_231410 [Lophiostoma macrostomum CBS 122681]
MLAHRRLRGDGVRADQEASQTVAASLGDRAKPTSSGEGCEQAYLESKNLSPCDRHRMNKCRSAVQVVVTELTFTRPSSHDFPACTPAACGRGERSRSQRGYCLLRAAHRVLTLCSQTLPEKLCCIQAFASRLIGRKSLWEQARQSSEFPEATHLLLFPKRMTVGTNPR